MDSRYEERLYKTYPKIFRQKDLDMTQTCMCWGIETEQGWFQLLDTLCSNIQWYLDKNAKPGTPQVEATQVKEKFGGLRFYYIGGDDYTDGMINLAESMSYHICQECGNAGKERNTSWVVTMCDKCFKKSGQTEMKGKP